VAGVQNCLRGKTFLALEGSTTSQSSAKKLYSSSSGSPPRSQAKSWNAGSRRVSSNKCSQTWRTPAVESWTLDDKRIIRPDKI